jgi:dienelactone hydrolase
LKGHAFERSFLEIFFNKKKVKWRTLMSITLWQYYQNTAEHIAQTALKGINSLAQWKTIRPLLLRQFMRSVGLDPMPAKCDLAVTEYGSFSGKGYRARKIAYQILPDCWATACLYYPDPLPAGRLPAVLYACGHHNIGIWGYQDHAIMWSRRGYICLVFDTIEQHDNPTDHHGLYYQKRYDWLSRGYSAAGGELWNSIRALDVLCAVPEVDMRRIGATGNSGGGAHSFFLAVVDERIKAVATSCGVIGNEYTLKKRHLMGHCDCMYFHNVYQRDVSEYAALIAPRPLLFCFAIEDTLFSPDEYRSLFRRTRGIYQLYGRGQLCVLFDYHGPHGYQPESITTINQWFDRHVYGAKRPLLPLNLKVTYNERELSVFNGKRPEPDRLNLLPELLSPEGSLALPEGRRDWPKQLAGIKKTLREEVFHYLEKSGEKLEVVKVGDWPNGETEYAKYRGTIGGVEVWFETFKALKDTGRVVVGVADFSEDIVQVRKKLGDYAGGHTLAFIEPRGTGFTNNSLQWNDLLRAGALVGLTPLMMMIKDLQLVIRYLQGLPGIKGRRMYLCGKADAGVAALYHAIYDDKISGVLIEDMPATHRNGAYILGILRVLDLEHAVGLLGPRPVGLVHQAPLRKMWAERLYERLGCSERLIVSGFSSKPVLQKMMSFK